MKKEKRNKYIAEHVTIYEKKLTTMAAQHSEEMGSQAALHQKNLISTLSTYIGRADASTQRRVDASMR